MPTRLTTTPAATSGRSSCPPLSPAGSGRCSTRPGKPGCSWCTDPSSARSSGTATRNKAGGGLAISPVIRVEGTDAEGAVPVRFIGTKGHGLVYLDQAEAQRSADPAGWRFRLARLSREVPAELQAMTLAGQRLEVPAAEQARFRDTFYPRLRQTATLISSDGSFIPPAIPDPTLVLRASYEIGR